MNTPGHLLVGAAIFARPPSWAILLAALAGAAAPDVSAVALVIWAREVQGISEATIFGTLYFSNAWQSIFAIDNSVPLWSAVLVVALWRGIATLRAFAGAGLSHVLLDLLLHHDDGRAHFWPFTDWKFQSPVSYWDGAHHGTVAAAVLLMLSVACFGALVRRFQGWAPRALFLVLLTGEAWFAWVWIRYF